MIRILAKLFAVTILLITLSYVASLLAAPVAYLSSTGSDANPCTATQPCADITRAMQVVDVGGQIYCINSPSTIGNMGAFIDGFSVTIDCSGLYLVNSSNYVGLGFFGTNQVVKIRNLTISELPGSGNHAIQVTGSGTLIIENCVFENFNSNTPLDIEPIGAIEPRNNQQPNIKQCFRRIDQASRRRKCDGYIQRPHHRRKFGRWIEDRHDQRPVSVDISNSTISNNTGNGMNAVSGAGGTNMLNIKNSVIARNGSAGIQANGSNAAALVNNTLLDSNTAGATSAVGGGRIMTYGNNSIGALPALDLRVGAAAIAIGNGAGRAFGRLRA